MPDPLIDVRELADRLAADEPLALLDVRWSIKGSDLDGYHECHIPGARFVDLDGDLAGPPGLGGRHPLPYPETFELAMRRLGVSADTPVVAYDASTGALGAARLWWLLRYMGHADVRVLDGGFTAWLEAGLPVSRAVPGPAGASDFVARPGAMPLLDAEAAERLAHAGTLIDVRHPERYRGEREPVDAVAGHIPGAVNAPAGWITEPGGRWRRPDELRAHFGALGEGPYGAYCGSGVTAAQTVLALERAGLGAALYPGSWSEWIMDPGRPVAADG